MCLDKLNHFHNIVCFLFTCLACFVTFNLLPVVGELKATHRDVVTSQQGTNRASLTLWERLLMYKHHECCSVAGHKPGQAVTYRSYDKVDDPTPPPSSPKHVFRHTYLDSTAFNQILRHGLD